MLKPEDELVSTKVTYFNVMASIISSSASAGMPTEGIHSWGGGS